MLALGLDLLASIVVSGTGGFLARKALTKLGQKFATKAFLKSTPQTIADITGGALAYTGYEKLIKGEEKSTAEKLTENVILGTVGTAAFPVLKGGAKGLAKITPDVVKESVSNAVDKISTVVFTPGVNKELRTKTASFFSIPNAIMETSDPYVWRVMSEIIDTEAFRSYRKVLADYLMETAGNEKADIVKKWIDLQNNRPSSLNVLNVITLEHLLHKVPDHELSKRYTEIVKKIPFYEEALTSFKNNLSNILKNAYTEGSDETALKVLERIDDIAEPLFVRYFPRAHIRLPHELTDKSENISKLLFEGEFNNPNFIAGVRQYLMRRDFPTIFNRLQTFIKISPVETLENNLSFVDFRRGSDVYKTLVSKFTVPIIINKLPNFLNEISLLKNSQNKPYALFGDKFSDFFSYANTPITVFDDTGLKMSYYLYDDFDKMFRTALDYHVGFVPDIDIGGALGAIYSINAFLKKMQLAISPFHAVNLAKNYIATGGEGASEYTRDLLSYYLTKTNYQLTNRTLDDFAYVKDVEELANFMKTLAQEHPDIPIEFTLSSNITAFENYRKHILEPVLKSVAFNKGNVIKDKVLVNFLDILGKIQAPLESFTFDVVYKAVKLATAKRVMELYKSGVIDGVEAIHALNHVNGIYGGASIWRYVDPKRQVLIRLLLFAPDWYLSLWRNFSQWMSGNSFLVASFYPTLARLHLWGVINAHEMAGIDYYDRVNQVLTYYIENFDTSDLFKMPFTLLHLMKELYKMPIPVYDKEGKKKIVFVNLPGIEFEPLEMIGLFGLARALTEGHSFSQAPLYQIGEGVKYWSGKLSSVLRFIQNITNYYVIGHETEEAEYATNVFLDAMESVVPISFIYLFRHGENIWGDRQATDMAKMAYLLKNLSFGVETVKAGKALADAIVIGDTIAVDFIIAKYQAYEKTLYRKDFLPKLLQSTATHLLNKYGGKDEETLEYVLTKLEASRLSNDDTWDNFLKRMLMKELRQAILQHTKKELQKERKKDIIMKGGEEDE